MPELDVTATSTPVYSTPGFCPVPQPSRTACERCHKNKEKCHYGSDEQQSCLNCRRLDRLCRPRKRKRMGRQPVLKPLPYGSYSVVSIASGTDASWSKDEPHPGEGMLVAANEPEDSHDLPNATPDSCTPALDGAIGRVLRISTLESSRREWRLTNIRNPISSHLRRNRFVDHALVTDEGFFNAHRHFMLGSTFVEPYRRTVLIVFDQAPDLLADAYHAVLDLMARRRQGASGHGELAMTLGARCLGSLARMSSSIQRIEDAVAIIMLGQTLLVYNALIPCPSTRTITRGTLLGVKDWYPALLREPSLDSVTLAPVLVDTIESLIRRELPVVRLPPMDRLIVDRFLGVTSSLLPLLCDLCEISLQTKDNTSFPPSNHGDSSRNDDPYFEIESRISTWRPVTPPDFHSKYSSSEVEIMLAQAHLYRLTALLIIHRLRFPLGTEDDTGNQYAEAMFKELCTLKKWPADGATGLGLDFPIFVAMVECPDAGLEIFHAFDSLRFRKQHPTDILEFISFIKARQALGYKGSWLDLVNEGFHGDILP